MAGGAPDIKATKLAGIQLQTSSYGKPIPIVFGMTRIAGNLVFYADFQRHKTNDQAGGKGGGPSQSTYTYTAAVMLALCEGPIGGVPRLWRDKHRGTLHTYGFSVLSGARTQTPWAWLTHHRPEKAIGYAGTALAVCPELDLGTDGSVKNFSFEVIGFHSIASGHYGHPDANPADIIASLLTDQFFGAAWEAGFLGDLTLYRTYCQAAGFWISPALTDQKELGEHIRDILNATNSELVLSGDVLKIIPYGDLTIDDNGIIYTPNATPVYDLGYDDFVTSMDESGHPEPDTDPIKVERISQADTFNSIPVQFTDRETNYNDSTIEDPDNVDVEAFGLRKGTVVELKGITRKEHAVQASRILAQRSLYCRNKYTFTLGPRFALLEPMDLVTLTDDKLGLDHHVVRIMEINEGEDGELEIIAQEWPFGVATASLFGAQGNDSDDLNTEVAPGPVNEPDIFDSPALMSPEGKAEVRIAASGGELWGGAEVWVSDTGDSYQRIGRIEQPARHGALTAQLDAWTVTRNPDAEDARLDTIHSLAVVLVAGSGELRSVTDDQRDALISLCYVGGELLSYKTANLIDVDTYQLASFQRGLYGTDSPIHAIGERFVRLDDAVFVYEIPPEWINKTLFLKFRSFNIYGGGFEALEDVVAYEFAPSVVVTDSPTPERVRLLINASKPAIAARQHRGSQNEGSDTVVIKASGAVHGKKGKWAIVTWDFVPPGPVRIHLGFRIVFYHEGNDPNDEQHYVTDPIIAKPGVRELVLKLAPDEDTQTLVAAVQALYLNERESAWATSDDSIVLDPDDTPITSGSPVQTRNLIPKADCQDSTDTYTHINVPFYSLMDQPRAYAAYATIDTRQGYSPGWGVTPPMTVPRRSILFFGPADGPVILGPWTSGYPMVWWRIPNRTPDAATRYFRKSKAGRGSWLSVAFSLRPVGPFGDDVGYTGFAGDYDDGFDVVFFNGPYTGNVEEETFDNFQLMGSLPGTRLDQIGVANNAVIMGDRPNKEDLWRFGFHFRFPNTFPTRPAADEYHYVGFRARTFHTGVAWELFKPQLSRGKVDLLNWEWTPHHKDAQDDDDGAYDEIDAAEDLFPSQSQGGGAVDEEDDSGVLVDLTD